MLVLLLNGVFGQTPKSLTKDTYYPISKQICEYPRQTGKLNIERNDSLRLTKYKTDSTEMIMYSSHFVGFVTDLDSISQANQIYMQLDSLITQLFINGLLTSDLLIKSFCVESKYIDCKGDTLDWTNHIETKSVKILFIHKQKLPAQYMVKDINKIVAYEIWVTFDPYEDGWGAFPMFDLILESDIEYSDSNFIEYLKNAKIKCLRYTGIQI